MGGLTEEKPTGQGEEKRKEGDVLEEEDVSFETLGLDEQLTRAVRKKERHHDSNSDSTRGNPTNPGKDVVARTKTGSGKTFSTYFPCFMLF